MAKTKTTTTQVADTKHDDVVVFDALPQLRDFAAEMGADLEGSIEDRADIAAEHMSRSQRHMLVAGLLLSSIKGECDHGQFLAVIAERGFEVRAAQRAMMYAEYVASKSPEERQRLVGMPKYKVLALASADPEVIEALKEGGDDIDTLSVRALQERIRELSAAIADRDVRLETAEAEAKAAATAASKAKSRVSDVPAAIHDIRAESVAQVEKARLALSEFNALGDDLVGLIGVESLHTWVDPTARLAMAGLLSLQVQLSGVIKKYLDGFTITDVAPQPLSYLTAHEVEATARKFSDLVALHDHEKALRDWERQAERPRGKGRPAAKPEAPKTATE